MKTSYEDILLNEIEHVDISLYLVEKEIATDGENMLPLQAIFDSLMFGRKALQKILNESQSQKRIETK